MKEDKNGKHLAAKKLEKLGTVSTSQAPKHSKLRLLNLFSDHLYQPQPIYSIQFQTLNENFH